MKKIFWGMLFVFFNFTLTFGSSKLGLIPDFVGYLLMLSGVAELRGESECFVKAKPALIVMTIISLLFYIADFLGFGDTNSVILVMIIDVYKRQYSYRLLWGKGCKLYSSSYSVI